MERKRTKREFLLVLLLFTFGLYHVNVAGSYNNLDLSLSNYSQEEQVEEVRPSPELIKDVFLEDPHNENQLKCLADNIYYEAASEPYEGKLAVATVTINRANDDRFPDSICDVVYQRNSRACQFSWTCDKPRHFTRDAYEEALAVAEEALIFEQRSSIIDHNTMFYHAHYVRPSWAKRMEHAATIGAHLFYKDS